MFKFGLFRLGHGQPTNPPFQSHHRRLNVGPILVGVARDRRQSLVARDALHRQQVHLCLNQMRDSSVTAIANGHPASRIDDLMPWAFQERSS